MKPLPISGLFQRLLGREHPLSKVMQRENSYQLFGHCVGSQVTYCDSRLSEGSNRNLALDRLAQTTVFPCKYRTFGCSAAFLIAAKKKHEMTCEHGPSRCVLGGQTCKWTGPLKRLVDHILRWHGFVPRLQGENILITATRFNREEAFSWFALQTCLGRDFVIVLKKSSNGSCCKHFLGLVALVGSNREARNFVYRLRLCGTKHRLTWEASMKGIFSLAERIERGDGLLFDFTTAQRLCNGTNLIMDVAISAAPLCGDNAL
ncbi:E3 ubiquitin-protein ligase sina [Rhipicephalus sanguineus]|uniref:E3 ubiquitin-protein ligase sina n=1 Tax=Rhipicephalus sanguineus TaxID=34632 RepID=UPI001895D36F|nr:E3 ubiquitin-protein ligase sina [Rhipicephalus sanguineus]